MLLYILSDDTDFDTYRSLDVNVILFDKEFAALVSNRSSEVMLHCVFFQMIRSLILTCRTYRSSEVNVILCILSDDKEFDAFVSYRSSETDEEFVYKRLYPKLEKEMGFKLCLHYRDFIPGDSKYYLYIVLL